MSVERPVRGRLFAERGAARRRRIALRAGLAGALLAGWLLIAHGWAPLLLEAGYRQESIGPINDLFPGRAATPFENYLGRWRELARLGTLWCVAVGVGVLFGRRIRANVPAFFERFVGAATPGALGAIRAWTCAILFYHTLFEHGLAGTALLPDEMIRPLGVMSLLRGLPVGYDAFLAAPAALHAFQYVTALLLLLGGVGLGTRVTVPAAAICYLVVGGVEREYSFFNHGGLVPWYVLAVLSCTRCGRGFSIDRLRRSARGRPVPPAERATAECGWARYAVWTTVAMVYLMAGLGKLYGSGPGWVAADNVRAHLLRPNLKLPHSGEGMLFSVLQAPDLLFVLLGGAAIGAQLAFCLVLVSRRARLVMPVTMIFVHAGIWLLMDVRFVDLMLLLLVFYDWRPLRRAAGRWLPARPRRPRAPRAPALPPREAEAAAHRRGARTVLAIAAIAASVWTAQVSFYPLSPIPLFTVPDSPPGSIRYERLVARYEDGASGEPPLEQWFGLPGAFRFRPVAEAAFRGPEGRELARKFLDAAVRAADRRGHAPRPVRLEFQLWKWDFANDPDNPERGVLVDRYVHAVAPPQPDGRRR